ncbi:MAG: heavy-metal-associated domain-containing protein [Jatrophihabitans sp.]
MHTTVLKVTGMTCEHCVRAVTDEVGALAGVRNVATQLVAGGISTVTVTSELAPDPQAVRAALDEAGDYRLADDQPAP